LILSFFWNYFCCFAVVFKQTQHGKLFGGSMIITKNINELKSFLAAERLSGKRIGFVPTMGALHDGHLSLVDYCTKENDVCVVSIFVNPSQFNDRRDLLTYPRTLENDCLLLSTMGCDYVFAPSENEIYPEPDTRVFDFGAIAGVMEGAFRPGHFNGVAQVVSKLFDIVGPEKAYFGEKDFQQIAIVRELVRQSNIPVHIVSCPTIREVDGLALSSRNIRLSAEHRRMAPMIASTLKESCTYIPEMTVREVIKQVVNTLNCIPDFRVEYFEIVDGKTLQPVTCWEEAVEPTGCIAVYCGDVRLIDNIKYGNRFKPEKKE